VRTMVTVATQRRVCKWMHACLRRMNVRSEHLWEMRSDQMQSSRSMPTMLKTSAIAKGAELVPPMTPNAVVSPSTCRTTNRIVQAASVRRQCTS